jgi:hypothetical protein
MPATLSEFSRIQESFEMPAFLAKKPFFRHAHLLEDR